MVCWVLRKIDDFANTITDYETLLKMLDKLRTQVELRRRLVATQGFGGTPCVGVMRIH